MNINPIMRLYKKKLCLKSIHVITLNWYSIRVAWKFKTQRRKKKCVHRKYINILTKDNFNATIASNAEEKLIF